MDCFSVDELVWVAVILGLGVVILVCICGFSLGLVTRVGWVVSWFGWGF